METINTTKLTLTDYSREDFVKMTVETRVKGDSISYKIHTPMPDRGVFWWGRTLTNQEKESLWDSLNS